MAFRLLVIDDSLTIRKLVELSMKTSGSVIEFATSGQEGVNRALANPPDVILLDFVLPDMKGNEVCRQLSVNPKTGATPVILMSAKHENVREQFRDYDQVVDFVAKPFGREDIVARVQAALEKKASMRPVVVAPPPTPAPVPAAPVPVSTPAADAASPLFSYAEKQEAARAIFNHLKGQLAQIPAWMTGLGTTPAATYFAKKILTPTLMEQLLESLRPFYEKALSSASAGPSDSAFHGRVNGWPLLDVLKSVAGAERTGELRLSFESAQAVLYFRRGELVLASSHDPQSYAVDSGVDLPGVSAEVKAKAEAEQKISGKPFYLMLAEGGHFSAAELPNLLARQGRRVLGQAMMAASVRYEWHEVALPIGVDAHGRPLPLAQLVLDRMRRVSAPRDVEKVVPTMQAVFERSERFSQKVRPLDLTAAERRVLTLIDGRNNVQAILERSGLGSQEVVHIIHRLSEVQLIRRRATVAPRARVMILEPDVEGIHRPLAKWLSSRPKPLELVSLDGEKDLSAAITRERPSVVIVNASAAGGHAEKLAQQVSAGADMADLVMIAFLDGPAGARAGELSAAGYDAVLSKPVHFREIEALLGAS